jgi:Domain of unknown function (DUF4157)
MKQTLSVKHHGTGVTTSPGSLLQHKCACGNHTMSGECDDCANRKGLLQRRLGSEIKSPEVPPIAHEVLRSPGQPLDPGARSFLEPRFGRVFGQSRVEPISGLRPSMTMSQPGDFYEREADRVAERVLEPSRRTTSEREDPSQAVRYDFSGVRVHTDAKAAESARAVHAVAYASGHHIVFDSALYAPHSQQGVRLLAHELGHVAQQQRSGVSLQRKVGDDQETPKVELQEAPQAEPQDVKNVPKDAPKDAPGTCGRESIASSITGSDKRLNGSAVEASLGADEFGNTSKLGADFSFVACKVGATWRFQLKDLVVPIASKVQAATFRKNIDSASAAEVTKDSYRDIVRDLSPTRTATFSVSCGRKTDKDTVKTYSTRKDYWNQQFVIDHEAFHRKDWVDMYRKELVKAESDVSAHSIPESDAKDAAAAVAKANPDLTKYMTDAYQRLCDAFTPGKESRAYDAGAPAYQKLVDEINARATKEKW